MTTATEKIARGEYNIALQVKSEDELGANLKLLQSIQLQRVLPMLSQCWQLIIIF